MSTKICLLIGLIGIIGCTSTQKTPDGLSVEHKQDHKSKDLAKIRLIDHLRNQPGVQITQLGNQYEILIRGHKSFQGESAPLYVLDGVMLGRSYRDAESTVDVTQIKRVRVLPPPRAGMYGSRGQNGVIEITTKTAIDEDL